MPSLFEAMALHNMPESGVHIGRGSLTWRLSLTKFASPDTTRVDCNALDCAMQFANDTYARPKNVLEQWHAELHHKTLVCECPAGHPCHGDVLVNVVACVPDVPRVHVLCDGAIIPRKRMGQHTSHTRHNVVQDAVAHRKSKKKKAELGNFDTALFNLSNATHRGSNATHVILHRRGSCGGQLGLGWTPGTIHAVLLSMFSERLVGAVFLFPMLAETLNPFVFAGFAPWHAFVAEHTVLSHRTAINLVLLYVLHSQQTGVLSQRRAIDPVSGVWLRSSAELRGCQCIGAPDCGPIFSFATAN